MEVYRSMDGEIAKYVHDDGSETSIKAISSKNKELGHDPVSCNKWAMFLSVSVGCPVGCTFCYLTAKKFPYHYLSSLQIYANAIEAIEAEIKARPELKRKFFKLSWMGMGDPAFKMMDVPFISKMIIKHIREKGYACGVDGVDVSTTLPKWNDDWVEKLVEFNEWLNQFPKMDINVEQRSRFRLFYSLISFDKNYRKEFIPNCSITPGDALLGYFPKLKKFGIDVICHHVLLEGVNDFNEDKIDLETFFSKYDYELRLLRFNRCPNSIHYPSQRFDKFTNYLKDKVKRLRYQISVGSEVKAACGMFLMKGVK